MRGWFVGQFVAESGSFRRRHDIELKWGIHKRGEKRTARVIYKRSTTIAISINGTCRIDLGNGNENTSEFLAKPGDYVIIPPLIEHTWEAVSDCVVLTVRTPSVPGDLIESDAPP